MLKIKTSTLDRLFSEFIHLRAGNKCEYCGKTEGKLDCSHFIGRRTRAVRYDPDNACCACFGCHQFLDEHPYEHTAFFRQRLGSEKLEQLIIRAGTKVKSSPKSIEALKARLKEMVKSVEAL